MSTTAQLTENSRQGFGPENPDRTGLKPVLSRNTRWGWRHAYDETVVGLAVYVRNDPVNLTDPDGNRWIRICINGDCFPPFWEDDPPDPPIGLGNTGSALERAKKAIGKESQEPPDWYAKKTESAIERATRAVLDATSECGKFLQSVIDALKIKNPELKDMTPKLLVDSLKTTGVIENNAPGRGHTGPAYTENGVVSLTKNAYTSYLYATLIHESFHLFGPENEDLLSAMKAYKPGGWGPLPKAGDDRTGYVARYCGGL